MILRNDISKHASIDNPGLQAQLDADLEEEARRLKEDLAEFELYPVLSPGISFRF